MFVQVQASMFNGTYKDIILPYAVFEADMISLVSKLSLLQMAHPDPEMRVSIG